MKNKVHNVNEKDYHHFVSPLKMNGECYKAYITVREKVNSKILYVVSVKLFKFDYKLDIISVKELIDNTSIWNYDLNAYNYYSYSNFVAESINYNYVWIINYLFLFCKIVLKIQTISYTFLGDNMELKVGDLVTRNSYNNDVVFKIISIEDGKYILKGVYIRLIADSNLQDLKKYNNEIEEEERNFLARIEEPFALNRQEYFYLPGKILHIDSDPDFLNRCLDYYEKVGIWAKGINEKEENVPDKIIAWLEEYKPNIVVITGHDAHYKKEEETLDSYKSSKYFVKAIENARKYEHSHEKLIIIAGACGSYYEELIKAGANFASSPKRVNIHALDPAIIAVCMSLSDVNKDIDLKSILEKTKYGIEGIGGIITKGTMYVGYPR